MNSDRIEPAPGQESVWDYPRPPKLESVGRRLRVEFGGRVVADTEHAYRVLETSHPPNYYFPIDDVLPGALVPAGGSSYCEWKGRARYYDAVGGEVVAPAVAWAYDTPSPAFAPIAGHVAFYAAPMDACFVDDELVTPQPGGFYGGWITSSVVGPFKGDPGTRGW